MFRRPVGPAAVLGLSLLATTALADNPDGDGDTVERPPIEALQQQQQGEMPGLFMKMTGDADTTNRDVADPELDFLVTDNQLDRTVALPEDAEGLPNLGVNVWRQDGDMKLAGSLDSSGFSMDYKLEGGSFMFHSDGVAVQTPVDAASAMTFVQDMVGMGMDAAASGRP